jgi:predicted RNA binding protein YcfA (HicA-like mRNA interferase family)
VPKADQVLKALLKLGWVEKHSKRGSHHKLTRGGQSHSFTYHSNVELGPTQLRIVAKDFGVPEDELKDNI